MWKFEKSLKGNVLSACPLIHKIQVVETYSLFTSTIAPVCALEKILSNIKSSWRNGDFLQSTKTRVCEHTSVLFGRPRHSLAKVSPMLKLNGNLVYLRTARDVYSRSITTSICIDTTGLDAAKGPLCLVSYVKILKLSE